MTMMIIDDDDGVQRGKVGGGHVMTGEALKKLQQQMKVNRDERRLTVRQLLLITRNSSLSPNYSYL